MDLSSSSTSCTQCGHPHHSNGFDCPDALLRSPPLTRISQGLQIGDYTVEEKIGVGGMGVVYGATHRRTGKRAAIKVLSGVRARDADAVRRFVLEIRTLNGIHHPNLVNIFSFGQLTDGRYYYVMEYLEGCSLGAVIRGRGRLSLAEALPVFLDVCKALEVTHARGIVHRDLKPDNVFLVAPREGRVGHAKLLDFGLAKLVEQPRGASAQLTAAGMAVGTPQYMAPEQCKAHPVDARTDLYALGVMMYEALTGRLPFDGDTTIDIWEGHVHRPPRAPSELAPGNVSADMESIILTLLAKRADERFSSAAAVATALSSQLDRPRAVAVDMATPSSTGASASDVARAIPSSIDSRHTIALGDSQGRPRTAEVAGPPDEREADAGLGHRDPAPEEPNPAQASALDIDLDVPAPAALPAWATRGGASGRLSRVGTPARETQRRLRPAPLIIAATFAIALAAAAVALLGR